MQNLIINHVLKCICVVAVMLSTCSSEPNKKEEDANLSGENAIVSFNIDLTKFPEYAQGDKIEFEIAANRDSVYIQAPWYVPESFSPVIRVSDNAAVDPASGSVRDFSKGTVIYTVTAENGETREWKVFVEWAAEPPEPP